MKREPGGLPQALRAEVDFDYIDKLSENEQRAITFYEYARHSNRVKQLVERIRAEGAFDGGTPSPELKDQLIPVLSSPLGWQPLLLFLVYNAGFSAAPFRQTSFQGTPRYLECVGQEYPIGVLPPTLYPWAALGSLLSHLTRTEGAPDSARLGRFGSHSSLHAISIPWELYTNDELIKLFRLVISRWRPSHYPEPEKKRGRAGLAGTADMRRQLVAYRFSKEGYDRSAMVDRVQGSVKAAAVYSSDKGWEKAIRAAESRIESMLERPFFG